MRTLSHLVCLLPALAACHAIRPEPRPASAPLTAAVPRATALEILGEDEVTPLPIAGSLKSENLELRQVQGAVAAPPPAAVPAPNANPNPDAVQPAATVPAGAAETGLVDHYSVTVVWVETMIGGTSKTWVPKTITAFFPAVPSQGPMPAKGEVGMGTLTGQTGKTKTVLVGAAPTVGAGMIKGMVVAAGVGIAGLVV
ncbi:hypothetical protein K491DRAFT_721814 [Lophiostoma macrostomum CBS 122681]|uniref:Uncharacterized protein n=1 Tax=Lophiostoma macrostomum CBS 122681 TaxID=1314788 RepID=A0A6A6SSA7_9PLEO|nr:hypothetical protein K491DRAFT_721814 [Lophiostoma macrostomum CBS 122681]